MINRPRLAILDMNNGHPNQGMRCLKSIADLFTEELDYDIFDVRAKGEMPDLSYDIYICSGGPGSPLLTGEEWEFNFHSLIDDVYNFNLSDHEQKKYMFFICHSFQLACAYFGLGSLKPRKSTSFGIHPVHKTKWGYLDPLFAELPDPFYVVESRDWQVVQPDNRIFEKKNCQILALEKIRTHIDLERAIMAVRFSPEMVGTQFHPEADAPGFVAHLERVEVKEAIVKVHGEDKYERTLAQASNPQKIEVTYNGILPVFIRNSLSAILSFALV
jgi:homoserine O-succinyltransferase/O-acetyltransferase